MSTKQKIEKFLKEEKELAATQRRARKFLKEYKKNPVPKSQLKPYERFFLLVDGIRRD